MLLRWVLVIRRTALLRAPLAALACGLIALMPSPSAAADDDKDQRYVFHEVDEGILRLDTRMGEISLCSRQSVGWACRTVPDERNALDAELSRLQQENAELKSALTAQRDAPGKGDAQASASDAEKQAESKRANSGDLARLRAVVGMIWQRLVEMMSALRADLDKEG